MARISLRETPRSAPSSSSRPHRLPVFHAIAVYCLAAGVGFLAVVGAFAGGSAALGSFSVASEATRLSEIMPAAGPMTETARR
jgi:hypothetical protein